MPFFWIFGFIFAYFSFTNVLGSEESLGDTIIIQAKLLETTPKVHHNSPRRFKRETSLQKPTNSEQCGKVRVKPQYSLKLTSFLKNLVTGKLQDRKPASVGEFPWMAALIVKKKGEIFYCGGALIDHYHIITTASCVAKMNEEDLSRLRVILGANDIYNPFEAGRKECHVSQVAFHKGFDSIDMENNIALVRLKDAVIYSSVIQPICLSDAPVLSESGNDVTTVAGWGQMLFDPLKYLNKLDLRTWDNKQCSKTYGQKDTDYFPKIRDDNLCAGAKVSHKRNLCQGNNGAPLAMFRQGRYELVGVTSWGISVDSYPCVFTRVDKFVPWIRRNTKIVS